MDYETLRYELTEGVAEITLNRPEVYNALNLATVRELDAAMRRCDDDVNVRAVLLTGAGALGGAKRLLHEGWTESLETQMARESYRVAQAASSAEGHEGIAAFVEKRTPQFKPE